MSAVRPYGDATDDGLVQVSFTLPVPVSERSRRAAVELARTMNLDHPQVAHMKAIGPGFTFFVVYGSVRGGVDPDALEISEREFPLLAPPEIDRLIRSSLKRPLVVVGACTGTDAHTVGLDAILSMKGFAGDKGLEHLHEMRVVNLGAQVAPDQIVGVVRAERADAVLISQVVTQRDAHLLHLREVHAALSAAGLRDDVVLVGGGPRFSPEQAAELGYDRVFGRGTTPSEVASYLVWAVARRGASGLDRVRE
ncbi:MAG: OAM dimerization domain-containing protein [Actinomycetota bacterium]